MRLPSDLQQPERTPSEPTEPDVRMHPTVRNYTLLCLAALFFMVVYLADKGLEWMCLFPALVGSLGLLTRWSSGPILVLLTLMGLLIRASARLRMGQFLHSSGQTPTAMELLLCAVVLAYVLAHYRLLALTNSVFPLKQRRAGQGKTAEPGERRSADLVSEAEMITLGLTTVVCTGLAALLWTWMRVEVYWLEIAPELWRLLYIVWAVAVFVGLTVGVRGYLNLTRRKPQECLLFLQDQVWRWTRREQGSLNRWLTWARLHGARKKGTT
jgi:hypothetical protein